MAKAKSEPKTEENNGQSDPFQNIPMIQGTGELAHLSVGLGYLTQAITKGMPEQTKYQRKPSKKTYGKYARLQKEGKWIMDYPAAFCLDDEGNVLDGGHRKLAVNESGVSIPIILVKGMRPAAAHAIDQPKPRTLAANLAWDGKLAAPVLAQSLRFVRSYNEDGTFKCFGFDVQDYYETLADEGVALEQTATTWDLHPSLPKVPAGLFAAAEHLIGKLAGESPHQFLIDCARGEAVIEGDPAFAFREWVLNLPPKRTAAITARIGYAMIYCWDKARTNTPITKLRAPATCPEIVPATAPEAVTAA
jgi:hypothetical protein